MWIEVTTAGSKKTALINTDHVESIRLMTNGCANIVGPKYDMEVQESYEDVKRMLKGYSPNDPVRRADPVMVMESR